jgi:PAS domain S-box-containing protein
MSDLTMDMACARLRRLLDAPPPGLPSDALDLLAQLAAALPGWAATQQRGLGAERELLQTILDNVPLMINYFDTDGTLAYFNRGMERITGWSLEDVRGQDALALFYPDAAYRRHAAEFIARADGTWADFKTRTRDGRSIDASWTNLRFSDGRTLGIGIDITARKRIEDALRLSEEKFGRTFRSCPAAMALSREDGTILEVNAAFEEITGYRRAEVLGRTAGDLGLWRDPGERQALVRELAATGSLRMRECEYVRKSGEAFHGLGGAELIEAGGERLILSLVLDLSAQRRTAEALAQRTAQVEALRAIGVEITRELDLETLLALVTRRACDLLQVPVCGIFLLDETTGMLHLRHWSGDAHPTEHTPRRLGEGLVGLVARERTGRYVNDYRAADLALPHVLAHTTITASMAEPLLYRDQLLGVLSVNNQDPSRQFHDADQGLLRLFASQAAIAVENARLLDAAGAQQRLLRTLATRLAEVEEAERKRLSRELHDRVGQNLTLLSLALNMLHDRLPAGLDSIRVPVENARGTLKDTMRHVRDLMGELRPPVLDDYGLLAALRWYAAQVGSRSGLAVDVEGQEPTPRLPAAEEVALFRIAQEAVTNVLKHARARRARIDLQPLEHAVRLEIADDGIGLAAPQGVAGPREGGWGLVSMRERAAGVGGRLALESRPGQGTRVVVTLPR